MPDDRKEFQKRNDEFISKMREDSELNTLTQTWMSRSFVHEYSYHFRWLGLPIIQYPQDVIAMQELIWQIQPDLIIETGVARGGSLIFYASMMKLLDIKGTVLGIDIDIRPHNRKALEEHQLYNYLKLIEGSSISDGVLDEVRQIASEHQTVLVALDSLHTHDHVLRELELYSPFVSRDSYLVVFDTLVEQLPAEASENRPWGPGDNPSTAVQEFLNGREDFIIDHHIQNKLQITVAPEGYLKRVK